MKVILHVDMDAFYASIEQHAHPELRGKPVIVGAAPDRRGVVSAASYEARRFGVHSAMPSRTAARLCPRGVFVPVDMPRYIAVSRQIFEICGRFTPLVEPLSLDEAFLDVTGARAMFGDGPAIARLLRAAIAGETGLTASVGVAPNKFLAKLASDLDKPDGLTVTPVAPDEIAAFLRPLPVERIFGVGRVAREALARAGARQIAHLQDMSLDRLTMILGRRAAMDIRQLAFGLDQRAVMPESERKSIGREHTFDVDCHDPAEVRRTLLVLVEDVGRQLRDENILASGVRLKLRWTDFSTISRQKAVAAPFCDDFTMRDAALCLLDGVALRLPVRLVGVTAFGLAPAAGAQPALALDSTAARERRERLSRGMDAVRKRFGSGSLKLGGCLENKNKTHSCGEATTQTLTENFGQYHIKNKQ